MASGARGGVKGPFQALITSPELCARVEQLGVFVRFECSVPMRLRELAILCVGHHWKAAYEWFAHAPIAEKQGVPQASGLSPSVAPDSVGTIDRELALGASMCAAHLLP